MLNLVVKKKANKDCDRSRSRITWPRIRRPIGLVQRSRLDSRTLRDTKDRGQDPTERLLLALHLQGRPPFLHGVLTMSSGDQHLQARRDADAADP